MYKSTNFNRFYLVVGAIGAVIITLLLKAAFTRADAEAAATDFNGVAEFLAGYGWEADTENAEVKNVQIPSKFNEVYEEYNSLQKSQGYDLSKYRTDYVKEYTFPITNYTDSSGNIVENVYAHVLISGNKVIGGDICCTELDGFMHGFAG
ncbi:MAG: DUF4830 domain-containing protein [Ruminiclostridium sp.]